MATAPSDSQRFWTRDRFYTIDGRRFPSVTTILDVIAKPGLGPWYAKQERHYFETAMLEVLSKPGVMNDEEWKLMRRHPIEGVKMAARMPGFSSLLLDTFNVCLFHHRKLSGGGYPEVGRTGPPPTLARIVAAADCFDAMTSHRAYRSRPFTGHEVLSILLGEDRAGFDPAVLWALVQSVGLYPAGTLIQTTSGYMMLSLNNDREDLRRPVCRVIAHPDGTPALEGRPEIWDPMPRHEAVARVIPPEDFDAEVDRLLAA